jgi:hypothetical protein
MQQDQTIFVHSLKKVLIAFSAVVFVFVCYLGWVFGDFAALLSDFSNPKEIEMRPTVEDEAIRKAQEFWEARVTKCGDLYYTTFLAEFGTQDGMRTEPRYVEMKGMSIKTTPQCQDVTAVERANKIECKGDSWLRAEMSRYYPYSLPSKPWSDFEPGTDMRKTMLDFKKVNGEWVLISPMEKQMIAPRCEDIEADVKAGVTLTKAAVLARRRI